MPVMAWQTRATALAPPGWSRPRRCRAALLALLQAAASRVQALSVVATRACWCCWRQPGAAVDRRPRYCAPDPHAPDFGRRRTVAALPADLMQTRLIERTARSPVLLWHAPEMLLPLAGARR